MLTLVLGLMLGGVSLAQDGLPTEGGFDAHGFVYLPTDADRLDLLSTWRAERQTPWSFGLNGLFEYAHQPLVVARTTAGGVERTPLLEHLVGLNLSSHLAFHERVSLGLGLPVWFAAFDQNGPAGAAISDMKVSVPIGLVLPKTEADDPDGGFGLSLIPFMNLPTGREGRFLGDGGVGGGGILAASYGWRDLLIAGHVGTEYAPSASYVNLRGGTRVLTALAVAYDIRDIVAVRAEAVFAPSLMDDRVAFSGSPGEMLLSLRGSAGYGVSWTLGGATAFTRGAGAARGRVFFGLGWTYGKDARFRDADSDGFSDAIDACVHEAEDFNQYEDDDGCPEPVGQLVFRIVDGAGEPVHGIAMDFGGVRLGPTDKEGRIDTGSWPIGLAADARFEHMMGWYQPQTLQRVGIVEGVKEVDVVMPILPGLVRIRATANGEPVDAEMAFQGWKEVKPGRLGTDGDGVFLLGAGKWVVFARADGFATERVELEIAPNETALVHLDLALEPAKIRFEGDQFVTLEPVHFQSGRATILPDSRPMLDELASNLESYEEIGLVEVQGHTDNQGSDSFNVGLSQRRVNAVRSYLVERGVPEAKLVARGFGESCPADTNATDAGRANNRRVQFFVVKPEPKGKIPCHEGAPGLLSTRKVQVTGDDAGEDVTSEPAKGDAAPTETGESGEAPTDPTEPTP